jgi:hypothetical protein
MPRRTKLLPARPCCAGPSMPQGGGPLPRSERTRSEPSDVGSFILDLLRKRPGLHYESVCAITRGQCRVSRRTVARYLAALVESGELEVTHGSYRWPADDESPSLRRAEWRWSECVEVVQPDGSSWTSMVTEFRPASGWTRHYFFNTEGQAEDLLVWCTAPGRLRWRPSAQTGEVSSEGVLDFDPPLSSRVGSWEKFTASFQSPPRYRMRAGAQGPPFQETPAWAGGRERTGYHVFSPPARADTAARPGAVLSYRLVLPRAYPFKDAGFLVRTSRGNPRTEESEVSRIRSLSKDPAVGLGFRVVGSTLSLIVPDPVYRGQYYLLWRPPARGAYERWRRLAGHAAQESPGSRSRAPPAD